MEPRLSQQVYERVDRQFRRFLQFDPRVERQDTCSGLKSLLGQLKQLLEKHNSDSVQHRAQTYHLAYNAVVYMLDVCRLLRKSEYSFEAIEYLLVAVSAMEANLILQDAKYLDMRTKLYIELAHLYEEQEALAPAVNILQIAVEKLAELAAVHEADPPVPQHISRIIQNNTRLLKIMLLKYRLQSGAIPAADWKKKVDQQFQNNQEAKLACLVECLRTRTAKQSNIFQQRKSAFKEALVNAGYEMVKGDLQMLATALEQQKQRIEKVVAFKATQNVTQQITNEEIKRRREFEDKLIREKDYEKASQNVPLEYHCQLLHYAYECRNQKVFQDLASWASVRIRCRRIEVKYITDVTILASTIPNPNIPNEYEKLPWDLNEGNLRLELAKLRNSGRNQPNTEGKVQPAPPAASKEPPKKGGKQPPKEEPAKDKEVSAAPTKWQLEQIKHKYVYLLLKRSMNPDKAIYNIDIVMGHEQTGPVGYQDTRRIVVPYIQANATVRQSEVDQYTGVQTTTHLVPYIILYHSKNGLTDDSEKKTIITDVKPLFGKHPMIRPDAGYTKLPVDLRQVPEQFIRQKHHDYIYLSYKTDALFNVNQRHTEILMALNELEQTFGKSGGLAATTLDEKTLELDINYDMAKLEVLFETLERSLRGVLGEDYYSKKLDFLTQLLGYLWVKYIRSPLAQFDYVNQQRLSGQLIDVDYDVYYEIIGKAKPIFLRGLKVLHLILLENPKADMILMCKLNLELCKLLEQETDYRTAADNLRFCLYKLEERRNSYLQRGLQSRTDKPLPLAITCSNIAIKQTLQKIKDNFIKQRLSISKQMRIRQRSDSHDRRLSQDELKEEQFEYGQYQELKEQPELKEMLESKHKEFHLLLMALHLDIVNNLYRLELKEGDRQRKLTLSRKKPTNNPMAKGLNVSGFEEDEVEGLASSLKQKMGLMYSRSETQNRRNLHELQSTLQKAGKLQPPNPTYSQHEARLLEQANKNPYAAALLYLNLAGSRPNEKKILLTECLKSIKKARDEQKTMLDKAAENAIFLVSTLWDQVVGDKRSTFEFPFKQLYDGTWPSESAAPTAPILVGRNANTISFKLPPQTLPQTEQSLLDPKLRKEVTAMSIYGKISAHGVDVSTNCNELQGTGLREPIGTIVHIRQLLPNNHYCFACASTDNRDELGPIGKTGQDIGTYNPLPLNLLFGYLAKTAFQLGQYHIAKSAAFSVVEQFCQVSGYLNGNLTTNNLYYYKFRDGSLQTISLLELRWLSETLVVAARCLMKELQQNESDRKTVMNATDRKQQQDRISNLLILSSLLSPVLPTPNQTLPFLLREQNPVQAAMLLASTPSKFMSPKLRMYAYRVMYGVLKWGLENNELALARRIAYRWGERKWLMLGRVMKIEQKKEAKKGKDSKQQEVKLIDKYVRFLVEKTPEVGDLYLDSGIALHEDYADYMSMMVERTKEQLNQLAQYVDNPPEQLDRLTNQLNFKLDVIEYLKDPVVSLSKVPATSPFYLDTVCRLLRRAIQLPADGKALQDATQTLNEPAPTGTFKLSLEMQALVQDAIRNDIDWAPTNLKTLIVLQEKTGEDLSKPIQIFEKYIALSLQLEKERRVESVLLQRNQKFDFLNQWLGELALLKATVNISTLAATLRPNLAEAECFYNISLLDLQDLIKKSKQKEVVDKANYLWSDKNLEQLQKIFTLLANSCYYSLSVQNWSALQNVVKLAYNILAYYWLSPFNHWKKPIWEQLSMIALCLISMLKRVKEHGYHEYRKRFQEQLARKELALIQSKMSDSKKQLAVEFVPDEYSYRQPKLEKEVTKKFWFWETKELDIEVLANFMGYVVQCLRVEGKYSVLIGLVREYSNATQHRHSLLLLPFLIDAQEKLLGSAQSQLAAKQKDLAALVEKYENWRKTKKKSRQAELTGQKPKEQVQFEAEHQQLSESIRLVGQKVYLLTSEQQLSRSIIDELRRDSNQAVLMQKEQRKLLMDVGAEEARMYRLDAEQTKLSRNRKNTMLKELIAKYTEIFLALKSNKTSKDSLSEIQNLHQIGNLYYAAGNLDKAGQFWNDSLANILQTVNPISCFREVFSQKGPFIVSVVGLSETLLAVNLLVKMGWTCFYKQLHQQRQATEMAAGLVQALFRINPNHPQTLRGFANYRLKMIRDSDAFADQVTVNLSELLNSCEYISWGMIDIGKAVNILPATTLMDYVATDIVKHASYSIRAKLIKSIALADIGMLREAVSMLYRAANDKDMPLFWTRQSDFIKRERGCNWYPNDQPLYNNSAAPNEATNKEVLENIKKLESTNKAFEATYGFINAVLLQYAKAMIVMSANQTEVYESTEINELRCQNLVAAEGIMRECLKKLSFLEEFYQLFAVMKKTQAKWKSNEMDDALKKKKDEAKATLTAYLKSQGIDEPNQSIYLNEEAANDRRADRLSLMARIRNSINRANQARNMWTRGFFVVKYALFNLYRYSNDARQVEIGYERENEESGGKQAPVGGKKDDKKGKKEAKQEIKEDKKEAVIDEKKEEELRQMAEARKHRTTLCAFWHIKLEFELGKLLYRQNRLKEAIAVLTQLRLEAEIFQERYFFLMSEGFILRCRLKLGLYNPEQFEALISNLEQSHFVDQNFIELISDFAQTCDVPKKKLELLEKAQSYLAQITMESGLQNHIQSKDDNNRSIEYCLELQLSQQNEQQIRLKSKKPAGDPKKAGKDDKKTVKKDDPKKKRDEVRADYKVPPLNAINWYNLNAQEKNTFQVIEASNNSNELEFNCYHKLLPLFLKFNVRLISARVNNCSNPTQAKNEATLEECLTLLSLVDGVAKRAQNVSISIKMELLWLQGIASKRLFVIRLWGFLSSHQDILRSGSKSKSLRDTYEDLPLNSKCTQIPTFHEFIKSHKKLLDSAVTTLKKLTQSIKGQCLLAEYSFRPEDAFWQLADACLLLAQYEGRVQPRHYQMPAELLQHHLTEAKISRMNLLLEANKYLEYSVKATDCKRELTENYGEIGKKPFELGTTKIDLDITTEVLETDYQYKREYATGLFDESKRKSQLSFVDLLTYLNKLYRQGQFLTFTNTHLQNNISKIHRVLAATLPTYKEKCTIAAVEIAPKKDLNSVFVESGLLEFKCKQNADGDYTFIYLLGASEANPAIKYNDEIIYGRLRLSKDQLSILSVDFYQLKQKMTTSDTKSAQQKERNYKFHKQEFEELVVRFAKMFLSSCGKQKDTDASLLRPVQPELTHETVDLLISILKQRGALVVNQQTNVLVRFLHAIKCDAL